jgi:hypothetical protein
MTPLPRLVRSVRLKTTADTMCLTAGLATLAGMPRHVGLKLSTRKAISMPSRRAGDGDGLMASKSGCLAEGLRGRKPRGLFLGEASEARYKREDYDVHLIQDKTRVSF